MSIVGHGSTPKGKTDTEGTFRFGPEQNIFRGNSLAAAAQARDDYANDPANAEWLDEYLQNRLKMFILLEDTVSNIVHIQSYDRKAANWATIFGTSGSTYGEQPSVDLVGGVGTEHKYYDMEITDEAISDAIVAAANAALANSEPWAIDNNGTRLELIADASNRLVRMQQSIWGRTFTRSNGVSFTFPDDPDDITYGGRFTPVTPFVEAVTSAVRGAEQRLVIPDDNSNSARLRLQSVVNRWGDSNEIMPWRLTFTDSGSTARDVQVTNVARQRRSGTPARHEYLFSFANGSSANGDVTNYDVTANFKHSWPVRLPFAQANAAPVFTPPSDIDDGDWDLQDPNYAHAWFTTSAFSGDIYGGAFRGDWGDLSGQTLHEGDIVLSDDEYYIVTTEHTRGSTKPDADDTNFKIITFSSGGYRGVWDDLSGETLNRGDIVFGQQDENYYIVNATHTRGTSTPVADTANFRLITPWAGAWRSSYEWPAGAIVTHSSKVWIANARSSNTDPAPGASGATKWTEIS